MTKTKTQERSLDSLLFSGADMPDHYKQQSKETNEQNTYAIVNGAGSDKVLMNLVTYEPEHRILFGDGDDAEMLEEAAPWLVKLTRGESYTEWLLDECFGQRLLLFMQSPEDIDALANHFKYYTKIEFPDKDEPNKHQIGFFSFYDPSIFPAWVVSLTRRESLAFFRPLSNIWYEEKQQLKLYYIKSREEEAEEIEEQHTLYRMTGQTLQALEALQRRKFCQTSLEDLKKDGLAADPNDEEQIKQLQGEKIRTSIILSVVHNRLSSKVPFCL